MKIAIVVSTFPPYLAGIGNVAYHQALEMKKLGYDVEVITPNYKTKKFEEEEINGVKIKSVVPLFKYGNAAIVPAIARIIKKGKYDIVHLHYPFFGGAEYVKKARKRRKFKFIVHYHMDTVGRNWKGMIFSLYNKYCLPKIIKLADKVVVTSFDYARESLLKDFLNAKEEKFVEVANGVDTAKFKPEKKDPALMSRLKIDPFTQVILFVGGLDSAHYFKGVNYLINAFKVLRNSSKADNTKLVIVGEGNLKHEYKSLATQLNLFDHVVFTGRVPESELPNYYNLADVAVLPSVDKSEAFGMVLIEAMACSKPVIATKLPGVRSVVEEGVNGLLTEPKDEKELASKILQVLSNGDSAAELGRAGRQKCERLYDWKIIARKIDQIYKSL